MDKKALFDFIKDAYGVVPDYPFFDENAVVRHKDTRKWFGILLSITADRLGLDSCEKMDILNVKCDPFLIGSLRREKGYYPAYHMNKDCWISIDIKTVKDDEIKMLVNMSYEMTKKAKKKI